MHYMCKPYLWLLQSNVVNMVGDDLISNLSRSIIYDSEIEGQL